MPQYIFVYLGGEYPASPEEAQKHFEKYQQWLISLGNAVVSPAIPFKDTHTVQADGATSPGTVTAMSGLSIIRLGSMEEALAAVQARPFLEIGGTLEISEMIEMSGAPGQEGTRRSTDSPMEFVCYSDWKQLPDSVNKLFATAEKESLFFSRPWLSYSSLYGS